MNAVGVLGGTFDPIHHGHLRLAVECRERLGLGRLRLMPAGRPPHREQPSTTPEQRMDMLRLGISGSPELMIDERELHKERPSYTIDTLESLRSELGQKTPLIWIVGLDAFLGLPSWHRWRELFGFAHFAVVHRPGYRLDTQGSEELRDLLELREAKAVSELHEQACGKVIFLPAPMLDISSTAIRRTIAAGQSIRYLLPDSVADYIATQQLYR